MKFIETKLDGAYIIELEPFTDHRGTFARTFCKREFQEQGLNSNMVQTNLSVSYYKHTLRGLHYQSDGGEEDKLVKCIKGRFLDVILDVRKDSRTFGKYEMVELTESNDKMVYLPRGCAHGSITLEDNTQMIYQVSNYYDPEKEKGIRWNDPSFMIKWPIDNPILSEKDANWNDFKV
ncbi:MAG: dTDP-4-dehydrorhamnose 3,5-epimerase [Candidatus Hodarchaeales archaeon]|jgi:dTDP-4-dehydrorhamnose 3,5-epimerase